MKNLLVCLVGMMACGSCAMAQTSRGLEVEKRVVLSGESKLFKGVVNLPCDIGCAYFKRPRDTLEASLFLRNGLDPIVRESARSVLKKLCEDHKCNASDEQLWSDFEDESRRVYIEPDHSLGEYLSGLSYSLADAWWISDECKEDNSICKFLSDHFKSSPYMFSGMLIRRALLEDLGITVELADLAAGMGDMIERRQEAPASNRP